MPPNQQIVKDWLARVLVPYPSSGDLTREVLEALDKFPTLQVKTDAYTYDSGQTHLLLQLHGTIPITYRSQAYHIPLAIYFPIEYPRKAPMVYVQPTREMCVRRSEDVEPGGRVVGGVVGGWERKWEGHSLAALLTNLQQIFSAQPPVYARPPTPAGPSSRPPPTHQHPQTPTTAYNEPPPPPERPAALNSSRQQSIDQLPVYQPTGAALGHPPPLAVHIPQPQQRQPHDATSQGTALAFAVPIPNGGPPPVPPSPLRTHARQASVPLAVANGPGNAPSPGSPLRPVPNGSPIMAQPQWGYDPSRGAPTNHYPHQQQEGNILARPTPPPGATYGVMTPPFPSSVNGHGLRTPTNPQHQQQFSPPAPQRQQSAAPVLQPRTAPKPPVPDLLSSDEDDEEGLQDNMRSGFTPLPTNAMNGQGDSHPPPARPLPPATLHLHSLLASHLQTRLPHLLAHLGSQTTQLESVRADLETGGPAIRDEMARLEAVRGVCEGVVNRVGQVVTAGEKRCEELQARGEVSVDEVVCSISIVHNQLIDLVAEDNAIEDTIYHLTRALDAERIDLDRFLKQIRILGREQYQKRALIEKITMELRGR